jgi:predicted hydrocarbon binding protein
MTDQFQYFYPNRMGKIILRALEEIAGPDNYKRVLETANLTVLLERPPSGDLERQFPFEYVSRLQSGVEQVYGAEPGREINRRVGRVCLSGGLQEFNPLIGIADLPVRALPLGLKLHVGFDMFAMVFNRFTDQVVTLGEDSNYFLWTIQRCPVCWQRQTDAPCCHLAVGILQESLSWATGGREFEVVETSCVATGAETCVISISKRPLK